jgi:hypothetical protein
VGLIIHTKLNKKKYLFKEDVSVRPDFQISGGKQRKHFMDTGVGRLPE